MKSVEFMGDGKTLLTASDDKSVKMWDVDTLKFKGGFMGHKNWVNHVSSCPDMSLACSGGEDRKLIIWDV